MAYKKQTWATGDVITEEKLNHIEDGLANAGGVLVVNDNDGTLDKTWKEIHDALVSGTNVIVSLTEETSSVSVDYISAAIRTGKASNGVCEIDLGGISNNSVVYIASSETEYPVRDAG